MDYLDLTLDSPAENLALDEALLDWCEAGQPDHGVLRFWEAASPFVVLGYGKRAREEVDLAACERMGVEVLRRCSGGGTVVQGPGCLSYSLILPIPDEASVQVTETNWTVMNRHRDLLSKCLNEPVEVHGHTDLVMNGRKFSGNAQRRRRHFLLFHGTFLLDLDLDLVAVTLPLPRQQPDYRANRNHRDFLTNLNLPAVTVREALKEGWRADRPFTVDLGREIQTLANRRYRRPEWVFRL